MSTSPQGASHSSAQNDTRVKHAAETEDAVSQDSAAAFDTPIPQHASGANNQRILALQRQIGNRAVSRMLVPRKPAIPTVQRSVFIGDSAYTEYAAKPTDPAQVKDMADDDRTRRFKTEAEMKSAAQGQTDNSGFLPGTDKWIRVNEELTVIGEDHGSPASDIIKAVDTNRFRYEGFIHSSGTRETESSELGNQNAKRHNERVKKHKFSEKQASGNHEAEHVLPKYARALPDMKQLIVEQGDKSKPDADKVKHKQSFVQGAAVSDAYSLPKVLISSFIDALIYAKSYEAKFFKHELKTFYKTHKDEVDAAIIELRRCENMKVIPDFSALAITAHMDALIGAYISAANKKLGVDAAKIAKFKETLDLRSEADVSLTPQAKEQDYLRDMSLFEYIKKAKANRDLFFILGGAHLKKLKPLLNKISVKAMDQEEFLTQQEKKNTAAAQGRSDSDIVQQEKLRASATDLVNNGFVQGNLWSKVGDKAKFMLKPDCAWEFEGATQVRKTAALTEYQSNQKAVKGTLKFQGHVIYEKTWNLNGG